MLNRILIGAAGLTLLLACNKNEAPQSISELQARVTEINSVNSDLNKQRNDLYKLIRNFNSSRPDNEQFDISSFDTLMGAPERELLKAMFAEEKDISTNGLLKTIVEKNNEIADLNAKMAELNAQLPVPYLVQRGDTHYEIVIDYLMKDHGLMQKQAAEVANKTALIDDILPGNQVWLMYKDGIVGSFVTQGNAYISPMKVITLARKRMIEKAKALGYNEAEAAQKVETAAKTNN